MYQLGKFIGGGYGLVKTYWLVSIPLFIVMAIIGTIIKLKPTEPETIAWVISYLLLTLITTIALWNASNRYDGNKIWKWVVKIQCVLTTIPFIFAMFFSLGNKINVFKDENLKVKFNICNDYQSALAGYSKNNYWIEEYVVDLNNSKVFLKNHLYEINSNKENIIGTEITELNSCTIIDKNNWQCNVRKTKDRYTNNEITYNEKRTLVNGVYNFFDMDFIDRKYSAYCKPNYSVVK